MARLTALQAAALFPLRMQMNYDLTRVRKRTINVKVRIDLVRIWERCAQAIGAPELVTNPEYAIAPARSKHLGIAQDVPNAENRHIRLVGQPVTLSRTPSKMAAPPPEFGEQTDEILGEFGFSTAEIAKLRQSKIV